MTESTRFQCRCKCHRVCHTCGVPFAGPNDYHVNCGDSVSTVDMGFLYERSQAQKSEPWKDGE